MNINKNRMASAVAMLILAQAGSALAQDGRQDRVIEEVLVTATKRVTEVMDTPIAVSAFDQTTLDKNHVVNLLDLQAMVPSLHIAQNGTQNTPMVFMRGIGSLDQTESGDPAVAFHVDGIYSARSQGSTILMYDLANAEILRGPQGTLFGRNSTGGVINLHTARPADEFGANFEYTLGNYNRHATRVMLNLPLTDTWAVRFAAATDNADGVVDFAPGSAFGEKYGSTDLASFRVSSLYSPNESIEWFLSYENFSDRGTGHIPTLTGRSDREAFIQVLGANDFQIDSLRSRLDYTFANGMMLSYLAGLTDSSRVSRWDRSWREDLYEWGGCIQCDHQATQHELQLKSADDAQLQWMVGYFNFKEENYTHFDITHPDANWYGADAPVANHYSTYRQPDRGLESNSIFAQATYHVTDDFRATLGLRHTRDERWDRGGRNIMCEETLEGTASYGALNPRAGVDFTAINSANDPDNLLGGLAPNASLAEDGQCWIDNYNDTSPSWDKTTGLARLEYDMTDDVLLYGSVATGFKSGTIQDGAPYTGSSPFTEEDLQAIIAVNNDEDAGTAAYVDPEENVSVELGYKAMYYNRTLQVSAALFETRYRDLQVTSNITTATGADLLRKTNAGRATIRGLEAEVTWLVGSNGQLDASFAWLDATYDEFFTVDSSFGPDGVRFNPSADNATFPNLLDFSGNNLIFAPEMALTLSYEHVVPLPGGATLVPRARLSLSSEIWLDPANRGDRPEGFRGLPRAEDLDRQEPYEKLDLSATYIPTAGSWTLEAFVNNATNEAIKADQGRWNGRAEPNFMWSPPRTFGLRARVEFN